MRKAGARDPSLLVTFILTRWGRVVCPSQRIIGPAPATTGGGTVPVVAIIRFPRILGRTGPNGNNTTLRLFGIAGMTVKVRVVS